MFRIATTVIALAGLGALALTTQLGASRLQANPAAPIEATPAQAAVFRNTRVVPDWGSELINPAATIQAAIVERGPIPAPEGFVPAGARGLRGQPATYTANRR
jgi:hypothetical protein